LGREKNYIRNLLQKKKKKNKFFCQVSSYPSNKQESEICHLANWIC